MKGDIRAAEVVIEQVDGKVPQTNVNAEIAAVMHMTEDQLHAIVSGTFALTGEGSGSFGTSEEGSGVVTDAEARPGDEQADHTASV